MTIAALIRSMGAAGATIAEIADAVDAIENPRPVGWDMTMAEWKRLRTAVFERDGASCRYCGNDPGPHWHCDHVVPRSKHGPSSLENCVVSCRPCNINKGARTPQQWGRA